MESFFTPSVDNIISKAKNMLNRAGGAEFVVLVGGFSGSPYAMHCLRTALEEPGRSVVAPTYGRTAVLEGKQGRYVILHRTWLSIAEHQIN